MMHRGQRGFTLVEILVVVAIIAILAALVFPVYEVAIKRSEAISCLSNIRNIALANSYYADDNDGYIVPARLSYGPAGTFGTAWDVPLAAYHRNEGLYLCPADPAPNWASGTICFPHSYGINYDLAMIGGYNGSSLMTDMVQDPTSVILFFEIRGSVRQMGGGYQYHGLTRVDARHNQGSNFSFLDGHAKRYQPRQTIGPKNLWAP